MVKTNNQCNSHKILFKTLLMKVKCNEFVWSNIILLTEISNLIHLSDEAVKQNIVIFNFTFSCLMQLKDIQSSKQL